MVILKIQLFSWFEDIVTNNLDNLSLFKSSFTSSENELILARSKELVLLRKEYASMVLEESKRIIFNSNKNRVVRE